MRRRLSTWTVTVAVLAAVFAALFTVNALTRHRVFSYDSMNYADVAAHIARGNGAVQSTLGFNSIHPWKPGDRAPTPMALQPPLYPAMASLPIRLGLAPPDSSLLVAALGSLATAFFAVLLVRRSFGPAAALLTAGVLAWFAPLLDCGRTAWSDAPGAALALAALWLARTALKSRPTGPAAFRLALAGLLAGLAAWDRYALAVVGVSIGVVLLLPTWRGRGHWLRVVSFAIPWAACGALLAWRNHRLFGMAMPTAQGTGPGGDPSFFIWADAARTLFGSWFDLYRGAVAQGLLLGAIVLTSVLALVRRNGGRTLRHLFARQDRGISVSFLVIYLGFLLVVLRHTEITHRTLLPAIVCGALLVAALAARAARETGRRGRRLLGVLAVAALAAATAREALTLVRLPARDPAAPFRESPRLDWIAKNVTPDDLLIGEDAMDLPFYLGWSEAVSFSPTGLLEHFPTKEKILAFAAARHPAPRHIYLVLRRPFDFADHDTLRLFYGDFIADLIKDRAKAHPGVEPLTVLKDARIFRIKTPGPGT